MVGGGNNNDINVIVIEKFAIVGVQRWVVINFLQLGFALLQNILVNVANNYALHFRHFKKGCNICPALTFAADEPDTDDIGR